MKILTDVARWFDAGAAASEGLETYAKTADRVDWMRCLPFIALHLACFAVIWVGWSSVAVLTAAALYFIRMFAITGFYHRYFSHKSFRTSRPAQFLFAVLGASAVQRGPLWWAFQHRRHHVYSDQEEDVHSPRQRGFWWAHIGWITSRRNFPTDTKWIPDLVKYKELVFLNRFDVLVPAILAGALYAAGAALETARPDLGTSGPQLLVWGFFISTIVLFHATSAINTFAHIFGSKRYETGDDSKNSFLLALLTLGEGWHNNHHRYMASVRQGFYWWEIDITYYILVMMSWVGIVWDLRPVPAEVYEIDTDKAEPLEKAA